MPGAPGLLRVPAGLPNGHSGNGSVRNGRRSDQANGRSGHSGHCRVRNGSAGRQIRDGAWLDGQNFPPLRYAVPDLLPAGFTVIAAPPKAGKSLLILDGLARQKASGGAALGRLPA